MEVDINASKNYKRVLYLLAGVVFFGTILDSISNAISLITPKVTFSLTIVIAITWLLLEYYISRHGIRWVLSKKKKVLVKRLNSKVRLFILGIIVCLWFPVVFNSHNQVQFTEIINQESQDKRTGLKMIFVEGGSFIMGSPLNEPRRKQNECQHNVSVESFYIGKYEVTQTDWESVMGANPAYHKGCKYCPVEQVSWVDVQGFIKRLNGITGKEYRLPTEEEWEFAARGGNKSQNYIYAGSNILSDVGWFGGTTGPRNHPVGERRPNELGIYDMSGNVHELCSDSWNPYSCDGISERDNKRVVSRGGAWVTYPQYCRVASRGNPPRVARDPMLGFRLAHD